MPLSLGHYRLLKRFDVAFVADGPAAPGRGDLILGLLICSMGVDEFIALAQSAEFSKVLHKWGKRACPCLWLAWIPFFGPLWRRWFGFDFLEKVGLFQAYLRQAQEVPAFWVEGDSQSESPGHWSQAAEIVLRAELGWTREEINTEPLSKALDDYIRFMERNGAVQLVSDEELAMGEANARVMEAMSRN